MECVCADLNAHLDIWDLSARPNERGKLLAEAIMNADGTFLNDPSQYTRQDPATEHVSSPDVTITAVNLQFNCDWVTPGHTLITDPFSSL